MDSFVVTILALGAVGIIGLLVMLSRRDARSRRFDAEPGTSDY